MRGAELTNDTGPALRAGGASIDQSVFLDGGFTATGAGTDGTVNLVGAHIGGQLWMRGAKLTNDTGPALQANRASIDRSVFLDEGFTAAGAGTDGTVHLVGAHIGGVLSMRGAQLTNTKDGPALQAGGASIDQDVFLDEGFIATGAGEDGALCLTGARVGEELDLTAATLKNRSGPALQSRALRVVGAVFAGGPAADKKQLEAFGCGPWGVLGLAQARIGGPLVLTGAKIAHLHPETTDEALAGPGLNAPDLITEGSLLLDQCEVSGSGSDGAIRLTGSRIGGELTLHDSTVANPSGPALSANRARIDRGLLFDGAKLTGQPSSLDASKGTVRLIGTTVRGNLILDDDLITAATKSEQRWAVEDLTYANIPTRPSGTPLHSSHWLDLLRKGTTGYAAQPYRHLAAATAAGGHDDETRTVLIAQREHQIAAGNLNRRSRAWAKFTGYTLKYGYQPWRALLWAVGFTLLMVFLAVTVGGAGGLIHAPAAASSVGSVCTVPERVGYALDGFLPLLRTGARDICRPASGTTLGGLVQLGGWALALISWAFLTLFVAGFTNVIRKT